MRPQHALDDEPDGGWDGLPVDEEAQARADAEARADLAAGRYVSWEAVERWRLSWGTADRLPLAQVGG